MICAPGHILKNATDHIKVDKRDAVRLARLLSAGELRLVRVPEPEEEQLRDLVRSREDLRVDLTRIRNRIGKFLLRREIYGPKHTETPGASCIANGCRASASRTVLQSWSSKTPCMPTTFWSPGESSWSGPWPKIAETSPWALTIARLRCLRGIDTLSASAWSPRWATSAASNTHAF